MNLTYKVSIFEIKTLKPDADGKRRPKPYGVRWGTAGKQHSEWYRTKALANNRRSKLMQAIQAGEPFDIKTGLPESELKLKSARSLLQLAQEFIKDAWPDSAANTRRRYVDTLAVPVAAFVTSTKDAPKEEDLRRVLTTCLLPLNRRDRVLTPEEAKTAHWIESASRPVRELASKVETANLLRSLARNLGGKPAAAWTTRTRRGSLHHLLTYAVDSKMPLGRTSTASMLKAECSNIIYESGSPSSTVSSMN